MKMKNVLNLKCMYILFALLLTSCGAKKKLGESEASDKMSSKVIIRQHYLNQIDFKTLSGKLKIDYSNGDTDQSFTVSLRMEKDKAIWISAPLSIVKAYITPDRVSFYNKLENEYFDGDFSYLSKLLGTELNFEKVQNLLMGQSIFDLNEGVYTKTVENGKYQLKPKKAEALFKTILNINPDNYRIADFQLSQPLQNRVLNVDYAGYQRINKWLVPSGIYIDATDNSLKNSIKIEYRNMVFNEAVRFPYKIPGGFKKIELDEK